jgi:Ca2+-binding EF-hand superfamily protein
MEKKMSKKVLMIVLAASGVAAVATLAVASEPYLPRAQKVFDRLDVNKDGKISLAEFTPLAEKRFMKVDTNNDGAVSAAEIDAALQAAMERRRDRILADMDADKNGTVTRDELDKYVAAMVKSADANNDGGVTFDEARMFKLAKWRKTLENQPTNQ